MKNPRRVADYGFDPRKDLGRQNLHIVLRC
uniref:Uncharacterized protein n=1 Tax=Lepeophtheirus salmonis TaxID=72036 RepID=A0A0K2V4H4_LEPSM